MPTNSAARGMVSRFVGMGLGLAKQGINRALGAKKHGTSKYGWSDKGSTNSAGKKVSTADIPSPKTRGVKNIPEPESKPKGMSPRGTTEYSNISRASHVVGIKKELEEPEVSAISSRSRPKRGAKSLSDAKAGVQMAVQRPKDNPFKISKDSMLRSQGGIVEFMKGQRSKTIGTIRNAYGYTRKEAKGFYRKEKGAIKDLKEATMPKVKKSGIMGYLNTFTTGIGSFMKSHKVNEPLCKDCGKCDCECEKSFGGIMDFLAKAWPSKKAKALKGAKRIKGARLSSKTYKQTAPAVKRSARAKLRAKAPKTATKPRGSGVKKGFEDTSQHHPTHTRFDRNLQDRGHLNDDKYDWADDNSEMEEAPFVPERARGYYKRGKKLRRTPGAQNTVKNDTTQLSS